MSMRERMNWNEEDKRVKRLGRLMSRDIREMMEGIK